MSQIIIHVDMDAFYASVEVRDNPALRGKPLIIGALPSERGVVATCSYEARKYGIHSAMNIKDAYRLCPHGIFMHPNFEKYKRVSSQLHEIWNTYASAAETIALDEAYLDVTAQAGDLEGARKIGHLIKKRTLEDIGLICSVGGAYSKTAAKTASEEKKPVRLIGAGIYNLTSEEGRQLTLEDFFTEAKEKREEKKEALLRELGERYHLDFAGHLEQIFQSDTLHRTVEYMRKHRP